MNLRNSALTSSRGFTSRDALTPGMEVCEDCDDGGGTDVVGKVGTGFSMSCVSDGVMLVDGGGRWVPMSEGVTVVAVRN